MTRFLALILVAGCEVGGVSEPPGSADVDQALRTLSPTPSAVGGCSDLFAWGRNGGDTAGIVLQVNDGLSTDAAATGAVQNGTYVLPDPAVPLLDILVGTQVTEAYCNDVGGIGTVDHRVVAFGGTVDVEVGPDQLATVTFTDLELEDDRTGALHDLAFLEIADVLVGWLPGR